MSICCKIYKAFKGIKEENPIKNAVKSRDPNSLELMLSFYEAPTCGILGAISYLILQKYFPEVNDQEELTFFVMTGPLFLYMAYVQYEYGSISKTIGCIKHIWKNK